MTSPDTQESRREEVANSVSHGLGFVLAVAGAPLLIATAIRRGTLADVVAVSVFAASMALLYLSSTIYHALPPGRTKNAFHVLDHAAIYLLIAGTYTPFTLGVLKGGWGWTLFGLVWGLAALGVLLKVFAGIRWHGISTAVYVGMGWLIIIAAKPLWESLPLAGLAWLFAGGIAYTSGVYFYLKKNMRYGHLVWHLFVVAGTGCHFVAILHYAI
ncbi:MAG TPA: hemolysin III family protein [Steroidobacteraceae bacterium]|jgi:hemolysin III|nr:hemolysin III family protein [Steroidobacteraceae bacterium]